MACSLGRAVETDKEFERLSCNFAGEGIDILGNVLHPSLASKVLDEVQAMPLMMKTLLPEDAKQLLAPIHGAHAMRSDIALLPTQHVVEAVNSILRRCGKFICVALGNGGSDTDDFIHHEPCIQLVELGAVTSQPGCAAQTWHADVDCVGANDGASSILMIFVALQDVEMCMGPTEVLPGTHSADFHASVHRAAGPRGRVVRTPAANRRVKLTTAWRGRHTKRGATLKGSRDASTPIPEHLAAAAVRLAPRRSRKLVLKAGDAALMDARLFHRGGPNFSGCCGTTEARPRSLLHCAFMDVNVRSPRGFTYTLTPETAAHCFEP